MYACKSYIHVRLCADIRTRQPRHTTCPKQEHASRRQLVAVGRESCRMHLGETVALRQLHCRPCASTPPRCPDGSCADPRLCGNPKEHSADRREDNDETLRQRYFNVEGCVAGAMVISYFIMQMCPSGRMSARIHQSTVPQIKITSA